MQKMAERREREERIVGGRGNCIVFRGSKISRPLILFPDWKMRQRKNGEGRKKEERTKQIYLNAVLRRKGGKGFFLSHFPLRWRTRQPLRLRDCSSASRLPPYNPTRYHFYSRLWRAFRPISFARGRLGLGCLGKLQSGILARAIIKAYLTKPLHLAYEQLCRYLDKSCGIA